MLSIRKSGIPASNLSLERGGFIWKETVPHSFIGIAGFAFWIPLFHSFQCEQ
jgi:hypothetical protein